MEAEPDNQHFRRDGGLYGADAVDKVGFQHKGCRQRVVAGSLTPAARGFFMWETC